MEVEHPRVLRLPNTGPQDAALHKSFHFAASVFDRSHYTEIDNSRPSSRL